MSSSSHQSSPKDERLQEILAEYLGLAEVGNAPDRGSFLARHPEFADELASFLDDQESIEKFVAPLREKKETAVEIQPTIGTDEAAAPEPGEVVRYFGDYELLEEIARGGMGVVYKARQVSLNRVVALKMILAGQLASDQDVQRFHTEAEAAANLDHPNIVPIYEVGEHEGLHYFSMGFVEGQSLAERLADGPLEPREAAELARKIALAMSYAHGQGVIHRDLKPANVLLDSNGDPRITDFGLAKKLESDSNLTGTGQILGTPSYMPPEQAAGKALEVAPSADVYALGAMLLHLLTGRPPFQAANPMDTLLQVLSKEPLSPRQLDAAIPRDLETICLKCLEKDPARRYPDAASLTDELERFLHGKPIMARSLGAPARALRWCRRRPLIAGMSAALVVLLLLGTGISSYFAVLARRQAATANEQLWQSRLERARAERLAGDPFAAKATIRSAARQKVTEELVTEAILAATTSGVRFVMEWPVPDHQGRHYDHVSLNYDASLLAVSIGWPEHAVQVRRGGSGELVAEFDQPGAILFSPTSNVLAVNFRDEVVLWDVEEDKVIARFSTGRFAIEVRPFCFSNDGELFAYSQKDGSSSAVYEIATGRRSELPVTGSSRSVYPVGFVNRDLLAVQRSSHYLIWNLKTNKLEFDTEEVWQPEIESGESLQIQDAFPLVVAFGDSGVSRPKRLISIFDLESRRPVAEQLNVQLPYIFRLPLNGAVGLAAWRDPDEPQTIHLYDLRHARVRGRLRMPGFSGEALVQEVRDGFLSPGGFLSPDGAILAATEINIKGGDLGIRLWDINQGRSLAYLHRQKVLLWSRDSRYLLALKDPNTGSERLRVHEVSGGVPSYPGRAPIQALTFDQEGQRLAANDNIWKVYREGGQSYLRPLTSNSGGYGTFVSSGSRQWVIRTGDHRKGGNARFPNTTVEKMIVEEVFRPSRRFELKAPRKPTDFSVKPITDFVVDPNGRWVAFDRNYQLIEKDRASYASCMELWNLEQATSILQLDEEFYYVPHPVVLTADGQVCRALAHEFSSFQPHGDERLYTAKSALKFWDAKTGKGLSSVDLKWTALPGEALSISFDAETSRIARSGKALFTTGTYTEVPDPGDGQDGADEGRPQHVAAVIHLEEGVVRHVLRGSQDRITSITESPDGRWLVAGGADSRLCIWNIESGRRIAAWPAHEAEITALAFHPDGQVLCSGDDNGTIKLWDLDRIGRELKEMGLPWD